MLVLVDTSVWSLVLRRRPALVGDELAFADELRELIREGRAVLIGPIRQELLSGARTRENLHRLRDSLRAFPDVAPTSVVYERAAELDFEFRTRGVTGKSTDLLICATALENDYSVFTTDSDFEQFRKHSTLRLHSVR
ncbi:MAG: PIN domain-containing protein [Planctomycetes bacterium]|nr:PIN domain-containing protein [Planctomycetota bacterium]